MRKVLLLTIVISSLAFQVKGQETKLPFDLSDSVKAIQLYGVIEIMNRPPKESFAGIGTDKVSLGLEADKKDEEIVFRIPKNSIIKAKGLNTEAGKDEITWTIPASYSQLGKTLELLIATANDSAENFAVYSGYARLNGQEKWKLIGSCRIDGSYETLKSPCVIHTSGKKNTVQVDKYYVVVQRNNGSWKDLANRDNFTRPTILVSNHVDSVQQFATEREQIQKDISTGKTDAKDNVEGVFYSIMNPGTGRQVSIDDTVTVHYKGYLYSDGTVFDQTKEKPATFPLKRLIRGWQLVIPLLKVGGKAKIVIPSGMAYSIRTRAAKIPPNSILVFEVEVVDTKPPSQ